MAGLDPATHAADAAQTQTHSHPTRSPVAASAITPRIPTHTNTPSSTTNAIALAPSQGYRIWSGTLATDPF